MSTLQCSQIQIMKIIFALLTTWISFTKISAQILPGWQFNSLSGYNYYPTTNIIHDGTSTFVCSQSTDPLKVAYIYKLDDNGNLIAQDSIHNFDYSILDHKRMVRDNSGAIYLCGNEYDAFLNKTIRLIKFDSSLNRIWDVNFLDSNSQSSAATGLLYSSTENRISLVGEKYDSMDHTIILKYDTSGNLLWESIDTLTNTLSLTSYTIDNIGNVILGGYAFINGIGTAEDFVIYKTNTSGSLEWLVRENGSSNSDDMLFDLCVDFENNIYASGIFEDTVRQKIFKYNSAGNQIWTRNLPQISFTKVAADLAGSLYIVGLDTVPEHEFAVLKYDSSGNFIHSALSDLPDFNYYNQDYFVSIQTNDSGNVFLLNNADSSGNYKWLAAKLDSTLNLKWAFVHPNSTINPATTGALCVVDDGIIVAGRIDNFLSVVHFEETFSSAIEKNTSDNNLFLWPNPTSSILNISATNINTGYFQLKIYDVNSKVLLEKNLNTGNSNYFQQDLSDFQSGLYFLTLLTKNSFYSGKFIIE